MKTKIKIALFFGGKVTKHLGMIKAAAKKLGVQLDLISYNRVYFETESGKVGIRNSIKNYELRITNYKSLDDYDVLFFRTTGKHWEEVNLIVDSAKQNIKEGRAVVVYPLVLKGRPSDACKAWQMMELQKAGIPVPKTIYGSLWWLYKTMESKSLKLLKLGLGFPVILKGSGGDPPSQELRRAGRGTGELQFPVILKGSGGDRGTRVFRAKNLKQLERLVRKLRKTEIEEGKRYMLQEFVENEGDYRVLVLGKRVLGVMKRSRQKRGEFRNNFSLGGKVEVVNLPEKVKVMAVKAAEVCGLWVAGVDVIYKSKVKSQKSESNGEYMVLEVNKGPQFKGFMQATGIDVPREIVKYLVSLKIKN